MNLVTYVPNPADPNDMQMRYLAVHVERDGDIVPLLFTLHEFQKISERAVFRKDLMPLPPAIEDEVTDEHVPGVRVLPANALQAFLLRFIAKAP